MSGADAGSMIGTAAISMSMKEAAEAEEAEMSNDITRMMTLPIPMMMMMIMIMTALRARHLIPQARRAEGILLLARIETTSVIVDSSVEGPISPRRRSTTLLLLR